MNRCKPFRVVIMEKWQEEFLKERRSNTVCLDATGSTNKYGFNLFTIVAPDRGMRGVPVAYMISQCKSQQDVEM